jgi:hypothetical protein
MPDPFDTSALFTSPLAPWFAAASTRTALPDASQLAPYWGQTLETQLRLWGEFVDVQRKFWSFYSPLLQAAPVYLNGTTKTVAEDENGLEPAETVDGIPDAFELQMRTWNHFVDANRKLWSSVGWPMGLGAKADGEATDEGDESDSEVEDAVEVKPARKRSSRARR